MELGKDFFFSNVDLQAPSSPTAPVPPTKDHQDNVAALAQQD